jgi:hypothetical protein
MSPRPLPVAPGQPAFLEGGRLHPIETLGDLALIRCCRCTKGEIAIDRLRVHVRPGHAHEATVDGELRCVTPGCGWRVRIDRGVAREVDLDPWDARVPRDKARSEQGLAVPAMPARVRR